LLVDKPGAAQTELRAYQIGPPRNTPDYFPLLVLNTILGGNFSSRLNSKLREQKGYTYGARSEFALRRDGGPFSAGAPVKTAVTGPALLDLRAELRRIVESEVSEQELIVAKATLQRSLARMFETPPEVAAALAALRVYGLPDDYFATYTARLEAVTVSDLKRVAGILRPETMPIVFVGDEKTIGPEVRKALGGYDKIALPQ
jgi:zinc protease